MRGVLGLAAALSIPGTLADGRAFPGRDLILFLTFSVILVTLVLQGLTLPLLIRFLGLGGADEDHREEACARLKYAERSTSLSRCGEHRRFREGSHDLLGFGPRP